jgi:rsbT co-antagonist protein RsbR
MTEEETALYAEAAERVIRARGERPRAEVIAMLRALDLTEKQAAKVIAHGRERHLFTEDLTAATLRARSPARSELPDASPKGAAPTARPNAELERANEVLRLIVDNLPVIVWGLDLRGVFFLHDGVGLHRIGMKPGQLLGASFFEVFPAAEYVDPVKEALTGKSLHGFTEFGDVPWENWHIPIRDDQGQVTAVVGISLDVSEAKRAEKELRSRLDQIERQQRVIHALSTPIIEVWDKVLTLPLLGVVDSGRAAEVMESLLTRVSQTGARFTILDLTGVEAVDTGTAAHLLKLIQAIRLLGAEGIITGIQPVVAQTMVSLGLDLKGIVTLANLRDALQRCMRLLSASSEGKMAQYRSPQDNIQKGEPGAG